MPLSTELLLTFYNPKHSMQLPLLPPLPSLPALPKLALPFEPEYSPWFPMAKNPWQHGDYEIKIGTWALNAHGAVVSADVVDRKRYLWDGLEWADKLPAGAIAWRGLAKPAGA